MKKNPTPMFALLCALSGLPIEALAQNNTNGETFCPGDCVPMGQICADRYARAGSGAVFNTDPSIPSTCPPTCLPTEAQCGHLLVTCPAPAPGSNQPCTDGPGTRTTPGPRHTPGDHVRPPVDDVCEAGAEADPNHPGTCRCVEGADFGPTLQLVPRQHHGRWRMELADRNGARHVSCYVDTVPEQIAPQPTPPPPPSNNSLTREQVRDMIRDNQTLGLTREQATQVVRDGVSAANEERDRQIARLNRRVRVRPGLLLGAAFTFTALPAERFWIPSPMAGVSVTFDRFDVGGRGLIQFWFQAGYANTGHVCPAARLEGGARFGYAVDSNQIVTPFLGWAISGDTVPCHAPAGGVQVADGVAYETGPETGVMLRFYDGFGATVGLRWNPFSRFTADWDHDYNGVTPLTIGAQLEYRLDL